MRVVYAAGVAAFVVTVFWLSTLYRRAPRPSIARWIEDEDGIQPPDPRTLITPDNGEARSWMVVR